MSKKLILIPNLNTENYNKSSRNLRAVNAFENYDVINIQPKKMQSNNIRSTLETEDFKTNRNFMETTDRDEQNRISSKRLSIAQLKSKNQLHPMLSFLKETIEKETELENEAITKYYFSKIKYDEIVSAMFTINAIVGSITYYEIKQILKNHSDINNETHILSLKITLIFITINTILYSK